MHIIRIKVRALLLLPKLKKLGWTLIPLKVRHLYPDFSSLHEIVRVAAALVTFLLYSLSLLLDLCSCWVCIIF